MFPSPPLTQAAFQALIDAYEAARENYPSKGKSFEGAFLAAKEAIMTGLDSLGTYVTETAANDPVIIITGGFVPNKISQTAAITPAIPGLPIVSRTGSTGTATVEPVAGATFYFAMLITSTTLPSNVNVVNGQLAIPADPSAANTVSSGGTAMVFDITKSRQKLFTNLQPNTSYYVYFAAGNSKGVSGFSVGNIL